MSAVRNPARSCSLGGDEQDSPALSSPPALWLNDVEFGWKAKLGLITPSRGWTPEHEWPRMLPNGVSYMVARMLMRATTPEELANMSRYTFQAAEMLASADVDVICYGCTAETFMHGLDYDRELERRLTIETGTPCKTMTGAVMEALNALQCRKVALVSPYIAEINEREVAFMRSIGLEVVYDRGLGISETVDIARIQPRRVYEMGKEALLQAPDADALFISCGNLRTIEVISLLEREMGRAVISSNQAMVWSGLHLAGVHETMIGLGSLMERTA